MSKTPFKDSYISVKKKKTHIFPWAQIQGQECSSIVTQAINVWHVDHFLSYPLNDSSVLKNNII